MRSRWLLSLLFCAIFPVFQIMVVAQAPASKSTQDLDRTVGSVPDPGVVTTRQSITPAGVQTVFESRVYGVTFGETSDLVYAAGTSSEGALVYKLDWKANRVVELLRNKGYPGMQALAFDPLTGSPLMSAVGSYKTGKQSESAVQLVNTAGGATKVLTDRLGKNAVGGVAIASGGTPRYAVVPLTFDDQLAVIDLANGALKEKVKTGIAPFGAAINSTSTVAYVSNWGGRFPRAGDVTSGTGTIEDTDQAVVDKRGIASSGTVSRIDLTSGAVTAEVSVGLHPTGLAWDEPRNRLYVANSNTDTISVIDTAKNAVVDTISVQPFNRNVAGVSPEALVLSKDGSKLYAACAGINAVAALSVGMGRGRIEGLIPTGWYPSDLAISPDGNYLAVSTLLGIGSGWKNARVESYAKRHGLDLSPGPTRRYVHSYRGTVHVIPIPDSGQLANYSVAVAENNHLRLKEGTGAENLKTAREGSPVPLPVPLRAGDPSTIEHVIYIIKENRSYDQYFGGLGKGNGDPTLEAYGDDVVPNQRKLARDFVLLDNFYATGGNSGDGHQWVTQASETDYTYWPGYGGRSYPKNGDDPLAYANSGFLWDNALNGKKTFEDFGEFVGYIPKMEMKERAKLLEEYKAGSDFSGRFSTTAPIAALNKYVAKDFPAYGLQVPDVVRARIFLQHLKQWNAAGTMPNLVLVQLPSDHTAGTSPGFSTPRACFADNDLAVGQIVEGVSHSKFWKSSLILVVEDDAQDGLDHVDGHRTVALAISPYIRRGMIDSTFYSQPSMVKTIELILGLPTMSLFDLIANDMRNAFQNKADLTPYIAQDPKHSIYEVNPPAEALNGQARRDAVASAHMNWLVPDAVPTGRLNQILWRDASGMSRRYPSAQQAIFAPYSPDSANEKKKRERRDD